MRNRFALTLPHEPLNQAKLVAILFRLGSFVSRISHTQNQSDNEQPQNDEEQSIYHGFEPFNPCL